jgi:hypothetical protein
MPPADASAAAAISAILGPVPDDDSDQAHACRGSSQAASANVSTSAEGPASGFPVDKPELALPVVSNRETSASGLDCAFPGSAFSSGAHSGRQTFEPGPVDGLERVSVGETAAVAAQRAAFEAALGMALEPDLDAFVATQLSDAAVGSVLPQPPAASLVSQQVVTQQGTQQTALAAPLAPVSDPVAMFLNDGPGR